MAPHEGVRNLPWSLVDGKILDAQDELVLDTFAIDVSAEEARLIAAAPDLLAAARKAAAVLGASDDIDWPEEQALDALVAAILKVEAADGERHVQRRAARLRG